MDKDAEILRHLSEAILSIDIKYRRADLQSKIQLRPKRNKAFQSYSKARLELLKDGVLATNADVRTMKEIREEITRARKTQSLLVAIGRLVSFAAKFAL